MIAAPGAAGTLLPGFEGATGWLNTSPLTAADLRGRVVVVDFWTECRVNWPCTLRYVRAWDERYPDTGPATVGVHTPEFPFEQDVDNVCRAASDLRVGHPIALDDKYAVWRAFGNRYWPALYIADEAGAAFRDELDGLGVDQDLDADAAGVEAHVFTFG